MNALIEKLNMPAKWFTGETIELGQEVFLEVDQRFFAPQGWGTYKFSTADRAAEFASQWSASGGMVLAGKETVENEHAGNRTFYYIYTSPLNSFYGECSCMSLGMSGKPDKKKRSMQGKKEDARLASQGTFHDFFEAKSNDKATWMKKTTAIIKKRFGLDPVEWEDLVRDAWKDQTPEEFVDWYQEKYNLDSIEDYGFSEAVDEEGKKFNYHAHRKAGKLTAVAVTTAIEKELLNYLTELANDGDETKAVVDFLKEVVMPMVRNYRDDAEKFGCTPSRP